MAVVGLQGRWEVRENDKVRWEAYAVELAENYLRLISGGSVD